MSWSLSTRGMLTAFILTAQAPREIGFSSLSAFAPTVVSLLRDHPVVHTKVVFEEGWSFIRKKKKDHLCVNHRVVSQEGDYCRSKGAK